MRVRVLSYNLHKCRGLTGPYDPEANLAVIAQAQPDIAALQEVDFRLGTRPEALPRDLVEACTGLVPLRLRGTGPQSLGWHGQTILLRPDLAQAAQIRRLPLPGLEPRGAISIRLAGLRVIATHLGLLRSSRRAQLARLHRVARRSPELPTLLTGDFNEWKGQSGLEPLRGWQVLAPGQSYPAPAPRLALDRIALSPGLRVLASGVHDSPEARRASDHLPIWAEIELSPENAQNP